MMLDIRKVLVNSVGMLIHTGGRYFRITIRRNNRATLFSPIVIIEGLAFCGESQRNTNSGPGRRTFLSFTCQGFFWF